MTRPLDLRAAAQVAEAMLAARWHPTTSAELDAALTHRDRVLDDLARLLRTGSSIARPMDRPVSVQEAATRPAHGLLGVLDQTPRLGPDLDAAPSDIFNQPHPAGAGWRDLNRMLLIAAHDWSQIPTTPPAPVQWGLVADVAALARAVAILEHDLATTADTHGRTTVATALRTSSATLALTAHAAHDLAVSGPTRDRWTPVEPASPRIVTIADPHHIPHAAQTLARMLHDPRLILSSTHALDLVRTHAATTHTVARFLHATGQRGPADTLTTHATLLTLAAQSARNRLWSGEHRPHNHPLLQARELHWAITRELRPEHATPTVMTAATTYTTTTPAITSGLTSRILHAIHTGTWTTIDTDENQTALTWRRTRPTDLPTLTDHLLDADASLHHLGPRTPHTDTTILDSPRAAHNLLTPTTNPAPPPRPAIPANPTRPITPPPVPPPPAPGRGR